jgi:toxin-antitoxin system PIN domain toxin
VVVIDANLLLYAYDSASTHHDKARAWLESVFSDLEPVGLPWQSVSAFIRILTNSKLPGERFSIGDAARIIDQWAQLPQVRLLAPGEEHWPLFRRMLVDGQASGPLATDAELAALTMEFGGILCTTDRDFARFPGLRWVNPLTT